MEGWSSRCVYVPSSRMSRSYNETVQSDCVVDMSLGQLCGPPPPLFFFFFGDGGGGGGGMAFCSAVVFFHLSFPIKRGFGNRLT